MVGTTLACRLGRNKKLSSKKILLLEASSDVQFNMPEHYNNRVVALNPNTFDLLNNIGAWQHIKNFRYGNVKKLQVWDGISDTMITFNNDDLQDNIAYIVENDLLLHAVKSETAKADNVKIEYNVKINSYNLPRREEIPVEIQTEGENTKTYTCDLLLGCDGANSKIRKTMGVNYLQWNYDQLGVVATLNLSDVDDNIVAWQRFLPTGPIALLPLKENTSSLVWSTAKEEAKKLLSLSDEAFAEAVNEALWKPCQPDNAVKEATHMFDSWLRALNIQPNSVRQLPPKVATVASGSRAAFPLGFGHATNYVAPGVALLGDAAHRIHPLAGQGVNLGFSDVVALDRILSQAVYSGSKLGLMADLKEYEMVQQRHNVPIMMAVDALHKLYTTDFSPAVLIRSMGLQFFHAFKPLKNLVMQQASK